MKDLRTNKSPVAMGVAIALGATVAPAYAQDSGSQPMEEVVVTGIRNSLSSSMDLKRSSTGVVDGIVAEDIGKFPDTNLAEAMQRIAGVSIDRTSIGEGQRVTVRGLGPDFNLVLLNGRQMPASSIEETTVSDSRAFDFGNLATEAVSAVEIFKTSRSYISTGGIGSTINIRTTRPLDGDPMVFSIGVKALADQSTTDGDSVTPEISGIFSTKTDNEKFGVSVTGSYQERHAGYNQAAVPNGWRAFEGDEVNWGTIPLPGDPGSENITNRPGADDIYSVPQNLLYSFNEVQRERINGQLALQWRPVESFTASLDYTYSEQTINTQRSELSAWFNFGPSVSSWTDGPVASPIVYSETIDPATADVGMGGAEYATKNEGGSLGLNLRWDMTDNFGLEFDAHTSEQESGRNSPYGSNAVIGTAGFYRGTSTADFSGDFPILSIDLPPGQADIDASQMLFTGRSFRNSYMKSEVEQARLSADWVLGDDSQLDFGVTLTEVNNRSAFSNVQTDTWGGFGTPDDYPDADWGEPRSVAARFDNMPGISGADNLFPSYFAWNFDALREAGIGVAGGEDSFLASDDFTTDRSTEEVTTSIYAQWHKPFTWGDRNANLVLGLRYEETEVTSRALVPTATGILWVAANEFSVQFAEPDFTQLEGKYDYVLPNIDFDMELTDDMIIRASVGQTIGRPGWGDIQGGQTINQLIRIDGGDGQQGDPGLKPLESTNIDLSYEWYYGDTSYVAVAYFHKDVDNYVGITSIEDTPFDLPHPGQGARYQEAQAAVGSNLDDIRNYIFANYGNTPEVEITGTDINGNTTGTIAGIAGEDPASVFNIIVPANQQSAKIDGWEFSIQHLFGESGFGVSANYTLVDSDIGYDNASLEDQFAIEGLSDSANVVGFFENSDWSVRLAYNWRDEFLSGRFDGTGLPNPVYTDEYWQIDAKRQLAGYRQPDPGCRSHQHY